MVTNKSYAANREQSKCKRLKKNKKKRKLSTFIKELSICSSEKQVKVPSVEVSAPTLSEEESILSGAPSYASGEEFVGPNVRKASKMIENICIDADTSADNVEKKSLLSISKSELESRTKNNTEMNSEYYSDIQLVLKPVFLNQPRPPSPIIGPCSFVAQMMPDKSAASPTNCIEEKAERNPSLIKWHKNLVSFEPASRLATQRSALKPRKENSPSSSDNPGAESQSAKTVTIKEFVYSDDNPISINILLSSQATSKYSSLAVDEFLADISASSDFKLSASTRRRLQITRKGK